MPIAVILPLLISILSQAPQVIESVKQIWDLLSDDTAPSDEEQAAFDLALEEAHKAVQNM